MTEPVFSIKPEDLEIQTFCSGGKGGQNQNKRFTGVRIIHRESGAVGESREERSQLQNKKNALQRMSEHWKFKMWLNEKFYELTNKKSAEEIVDKKMQLENLKIETKDENGKWEVEKP